MSKYFRSVGNMCPIVEVVDAKYEIKKIMTGCGEEVRNLHAYLSKCENNICPYCKRICFPYMLSDNY